MGPIQEVLAIEMPRRPELVDYFAYDILPAQNPEAGLWQKAPLNYGE